MPEAVAVGIAKAVLARIRAAEYSQKFESDRNYATWDRKLESMDVLELSDCDKVHVDIVGVSTDQEEALSSRTMMQCTVPIDIAVRRKFGPDKQNDNTGQIEVEAIDALMLLVEEICFSFNKLRLTDANLSIWQTPKILVAPNLKHLREMRQFTGIIRLTFRADVKLT